MQQISSRSTFFYKRIFPPFWFGFVVIFAFIVVFTSNAKDGRPLFLLVVPGFLLVIGYFIMKTFIWDLADQVFDAGDILIVRFGNEEDRISLSNIMNVSYAYMVNPPRVTLTLRAPSRFGSEVSFSPPSPLHVFWPLKKNPLIADLIQRVDAARQTAQ
jgi:hypothetical protein